MGNGKPSKKKKEVYEEENKEMMEKWKQHTSNPKKGYKKTQGEDKHIKAGLLDLTPGFSMFHLKSRRA